MEETVAEEEERRTFHGLQHPEDYDTFPSGYLSLVVEPKVGGFRLAAVVVNGEVSFYGGDGKPASWGKGLGHIRDEILELGFDNCMIDGQVKMFESARNFILKRKQPSEREMSELRAQAQYHVFDWIDLARVKHIENARHQSVPCFMVPLYEREQVLASYLYGSQMTGILQAVPRTKVIDEVDLTEALDTAMRDGYGGVVLKVPASVYNFTRSKAWRVLRFNAPEESGAATA